MCSQNSRGKWSDNERKVQEKPEVPPFVIFNRHVVSHWGDHTFDSRTVVGLAGGPEFKASLGYTVTSCQRAQGGKRGEESGERNKFRV